MIGLAVDIKYHYRGSYFSVYNYSTIIGEELDGGCDSFSNACDVYQEE